MAWSDEIIKIQQQPDGTYIYELPEIECVRHSANLDVLKTDLIEKLKSQTGRHPARLSEIDAQLEVLQAEREALEQERENVLASAEPIVATELLEQLPMMDRNLRLFLIDHPIEQYLHKDVVCVGFKIDKDVDGDGDVELAPVLHFSRVIK